MNGRDLTKGCDAVVVTDVVAIVVVVVVTPSNV